MKREERIKQEKGITMLALVIMIIVLLILASVTIAGLTADNGVIKEATTAKEQAEKAGLEEQIELALVKVESKYRNPTIDNVIEELKNRDIISKDEQVDKETGDIITNLGYKIEGKLDDYIGKVTTGNTTGGNNTSGSGNTTGGNSSSGGNTTGGNTSGGGNTTGGNSTGGGEIAVPDLKDSEVNFKLSKDDWTNQSITVEIACSVTGYTLQYSTNGRDWNNYVNAIGVDENGYVYARLTNNSGKTGGSVRKQITNIDKLLPKQFTPTATSTTNSITLIGSTVDAEQTETNGISGIDKYYFSKDNGATWEPSNGQTGTSYTFNNLTQNQSYSLKMKATDRAGNEVITETVNKTTGTVTDLTSSNVTFMYNPATPTRGNVTVSITTTVTGYTLQYSTNGTTWDNYTTAITMTNNGEIHARLWDGTNAGGYATGNVANIDRLAPNQFTPTATSTSRTITLTGSTTDVGTGIDKYYFSKDNGATWEPTNGQIGTSYTFSDLTLGETYQLKMKAIDKAGNEVTTTTINKITEMALPSTNDTTPYLPTGSTIINDDLNTGVIIKDSKNNEWVWVEVPKSIYTNTNYNEGTAPTSSEDYAKIESVMQSYVSVYRESAYVDSFYSTEQHGFANSTEYENWKNSMLKSVYENGGFYIGRYEVGTETARYTKDDALTEPLIKRDKYPYVCVAGKQAQSLSKQLATGGKTSSLMFGIQWDLVMKWIEEKGEKTQAELKSDSTNWGNYENSVFEVNRGKYMLQPLFQKHEWNKIVNYTKSSSTAVLLTTGATDRNSVLGIYDLAGNATEWTLEHHKGLASMGWLGCGRGGEEEEVVSASSHIFDAADGTINGFAFRPTLW